MLVPKRVKALKRTEENILIKFQAAAELVASTREAVAQAMEARMVAKSEMAKVEDELVGAREQLSQARMEKADHDAAKLGQQGGVWCRNCSR